MKPFPWRPGMLAAFNVGVAQGRVLQVRSDGRLDVWYTEPGQRRCRLVWSPDTCHPDPNDPATRGALLEVVREVWACPAAQVSPWTRWDRDAQVMRVAGWRVFLNDTADQHFPRGREYARTEFEALLAAYEAAP